MSTVRISLVVPTIRSLSFLSEWEGLLPHVELVIVEDHGSKQVPSPSEGQFSAITHYTWTDIKNDFGANEWIFSRQNAGIRSYGFWKAWKSGADVIITLDDDCYPVDRDFLERHISNLSVRSAESWFPTFPHPDFMYTRGFPYSLRNHDPVMVSHGLWTRHIDLDGMTQKKHPDLKLPGYPPMRAFIPKGQYFPMCSMNLAFRREVTPLMYFPLMGKDPQGQLWGFDRFDDIWAGIFAKKIMDHLGYAAVNGSPFVEHRKASDADSNIRKEQSGIQVNESLWLAVDRVELTEKTPAACYRQLAERVQFPDSDYFRRLREAMVIWTGLFF